MDQLLSALAIDASEDVNKKSSVIFNFSDESDADFGQEQQQIIDQHYLASAFCSNVLFKCFPNQLIKESCSSSIEGAVVIVDISGFSGYASELGLLGSEGLDKLQMITNDFLGQFVQCVYRYGGDVVAFAGDALICLFQVDHTSDRDNPCYSLEQTCCHALTCAFEMKDLGTSNLSTHIGVSCGLLKIAALGGVNNEWNYVMHGPCLFDLQSCLHDADSQEVVCSKECGERARIFHPEITYYIIEDSGNYLIETILMPFSYTSSRSLTNLVQFTMPTKPQMTSVNELKYDSEYDSEQEKSISIHSNSVKGNQITTTNILPKNVPKNIIPKKENLITKQQPTNVSLLLSSTFSSLSSLSSSVSLTATATAASSPKLSPVKPIKYTVNNKQPQQQQPLLHIQESATATAAATVTSSDIDTVLSDLHPPPVAADDNSNNIINSKNEHNSEPYLDTNELDIHTTPPPATTSSHIYNIPNIHAADPTHINTHTHHTHSHSHSHNHTQGQEINQQNSDLVISDKNSPLTLHDRLQKLINFQTNKLKSIQFISQPVRSALNYHVPSSSSSSSVKSATHVSDITIMTNIMRSMSEMRNVTTLFVNITTFDIASDTDPIELQPLYILLQNTLITTGGFLRQFLIDDKGVVAIIMFGIQGFTYGNDEERAIEFAWLFTHHIKFVNHSCCIGISTGNTYCGVVGSLIRADFTCIGHEVNMAARLMAKAESLDAAPYHVLIDSKLLLNLHAKNKDCLTPYKELTLKGSSVPITPLTFIEGLTTFSSNNNYDTNHKNAILRSDVIRKLHKVITVRKVIGGMRKSVPSAAAVASNSTSTTTTTSTLVATTAASATAAADRSSLFDNHIIVGSSTAMTDDRTPTNAQGKRKVSNGFNNSSHSNSSSNNSSGSSSSGIGFKGSTRYRRLTGGHIDDNDEEKSAIYISGTMDDKIKTGVYHMEADIPSTQHSKPSSRTDEQSVNSSSATAATIGGGGGGGGDNELFGTSINTPIAADVINTTTGSSSLIPLPSSSSSLSSSMSMPAVTLSDTHGVTGTGSSAAKYPNRHSSSHQPKLHTQSSIASATSNTIADSPDDSTSSSPLHKFIILMGKAGTGKSASARFFKLRALKAQISVHEVKCRQEDQALPYAIIRKMFWSLGNANTQIVNNALASLHSSKGGGSRRNSMGGSSSKKMSGKADMGREGVGGISSVSPGKGGLFANSKRRNRSLDQLTADAVAANIITAAIATATTSSKQSNRHGTSEKDESTGTDKSMKSENKSKINVTIDGQETLQLPLSDTPSTVATTATSSSENTNTTTTTTAVDYQTKDVTKSQSVLPPPSEISKFQYVLSIFQSIYFETMHQHNTDIAVDIDEFNDTANDTFKTICKILNVTPPAGYVLPSMVYGLKTHRSLKFQLTLPASTDCPAVMYSPSGRHDSCTEKSTGRGTARSVTTASTPKSILSERGSGIVRELLTIRRVSHTQPEQHQPTLSAATIAVTPVNSSRTSAAAAAAAAGAKTPTVKTPTKTPSKLSLNTSNHNPPTSSKKRPVRRFSLDHNTITTAGLGAGAGAEGGTDLSGNSPVPAAARHSSPMKQLSRRELFLQQRPSVSAITTSHDTNNNNAQSSSSASASSSWIISRLLIAMLNQLIGGINTSYILWDAHYCDEMSWFVFSQFRHFKINVAVLMTMVGTYVEDDVNQPASVTDGTAAAGERIGVRESNLPTKYDLKLNTTYNNQLPASQNSATTPSSSHSNSAINSGFRTFGNQLKSRVAFVSSQFAHFSGKDTSDKSSCKSVKFENNFKITSNKDTGNNNNNNNNNAINSNKENRGIENIHFLGSDVCEKKDTRGIGLRSIRSTLEKVVGSLGSSMTSMSRGNSKLQLRSVVITSATGAGADAAMASSQPSSTVILESSPADDGIKTVLTATTSRTSPVTTAAPATAGEGGDTTDVKDNSNTAAVAAASVSVVKAKDASIKLDDKIPLQRSKSFYRKLSSQTQGEYSSAASAALTLSQLSAAAAALAVETTTAGNSVSASPTRATGTDSYSTKSAAFGIASHEPFTTTTNNTNINNSSKQTTQFNNNMSSHFSEISSSALKVTYIYETSVAFKSILQDKEYVELIGLTELTKFEVQQVLKTVIGVENIPDIITEHVYEACAGSSFWVKEVAKFIKKDSIPEYMKKIVSNNALNTASTGAAMSSPSYINSYSSNTASTGSNSNSQHSISKSISIGTGLGGVARRADFDPLKNVIISRLDKLTPDALSVVKHASVIGLDFSINSLSNILKYKVQDLIDNIVCLRDLGLIFCLEESPLLIYAFQNQIIQHTIYNMIPPGDAALIHLAIAVNIEQQYEGRLNPFYQSLSYHYSHVKEKYALALSYGIKAANESLDMQSYQNALDLVISIMKYARQPLDFKALHDVVNRALFAIKTDKDKRIQKDKNETSLSQSTFYYNSKSFFKSFIKTNPASISNKSSSKKGSNGFNENDSISKASSPLQIQARNEAIEACNQAMNRCKIISKQLSLYEKEIRIMKQQQLQLQQQEAANNKRNNPFNPTGGSSGGGGNNNALMMVRADSRGNLINVERDADMIVERKSHKVSRNVSLNLNIENLNPNFALSRKRQQSWGLHLSAQSSPRTRPGTAAGNTGAGTGPGLPTGILGTTTAGGGVSKITNGGGISNRFLVNSNTRVVSTNSSKANGTGGSGTSEGSSKEQMLMSHPESILDRPASSKVLLNPRFAIINAPVAVSGGSQITASTDGTADKNIRHSRFQSIKRPLPFTTSTTSANPAKETTIESAMLRLLAHFTGYMFTNSRQRSYTTATHIKSSKVVPIGENSNSNT